MDEFGVGFDTFFTLIDQLPDAVESDVPAFRIRRSTVIDDS